MHCSCLQLQSQYVVPYTNVVTEVISTITVAVELHVLVETMMLFAFPTNTSASVCCFVIMNLPCSFCTLTSYTCRTVLECKPCNGVVTWFRLLKKLTYLYALAQTVMNACSICDCTKQGTEHGFGQSINTDELDEFLIATYAMWHMLSKQETCTVVCMHEATRAHNLVTVKVN